MHCPPLQADLVLGPWLQGSATLLCMGQPQSLVEESYETGSHFMSYFDNFVGQQTLLVSGGPPLSINLWLLLVEYY